MLRRLLDRRADPAVDPLAGVPTGPKAAARKLIPIFGTSGSGKTTLMAQLCRQAVERGVSCTWVDHTGDNQYVARFGIRSGHECAVVRTPEGWLAHVRRAARAARPYNIVIVPEAGMDPLWSMILQAGNCLVAIDEAEQYGNANDPQFTARPLGRLISGGRNRQVSAIATVRLPPELHGLYKGLATSVISFRHENADYAKQIAGKYFGGAHPRAADMLLRGLQKFEFLRYTASTGRLEFGQVERPVQ
jgi:GTPase SAR1 family protein